MAHLLKQSFLAFRTAEGCLSGEALSLPLISLLELPVSDLPLEVYMSPLSICWEEVPFTFVKPNDWVYDSDFGWLECCLLAKEYVDTQRRRKDDSECSLGD